jgi:hypothetical protein
VQVDETRYPTFAANVPDQFHDDLGARGIKRRYGLVAQQDRRVLHQTSDDPDPLPLPARKFAGAAVKKLTEPDGPITPTISPFATQKVIFFTAGLSPLRYDFSRPRTSSIFRKWRVTSFSLREGTCGKNVRKPLPRRFVAFISA